MIARYEIMIARYDIGGIHWEAKLDEDGPWVRWNDLRTHVDIALTHLNGDAPDLARAALEKIVNRERDE
jgi:hypothetical protein